MRPVKDIISSIENRIKVRGRKGYQALSRTFAQLRGRRGSATGSPVRRSSRSKSAQR